MKKFVFSLSAVFLATSTCLSMLTSFNAMAQSNPPAQYTELEQKFEAASSTLTIQDLIGNYLGRCFGSNSETPLGMILSTVQQEEGPVDEGPLFPPVTVYKMDMISVVNEDYAANDSVTQSQIDLFWQNPSILFSNGASVPIVFTNLVLTQDTAASQMHATYTSADGATVTDSMNVIVKKSSNGFLYGKLKGSDDFSASDTRVSYCYFWKKLNL